MSKFGVGKDFLLEAKQLAGELGKTVQHSATDLLTESHLTSRIGQTLHKDTDVSRVQIHLSHSPELVPFNRDHEQHSWSKPTGLWLGNGFDWADQLSSMGWYDLPLHAFAVDTSKLNMLRIASPKKLTAFINQYGYESGASRAQIIRSAELDAVDWPRTTQTYDGVKFSKVPDFRMRPGVPAWFSGLDIDSSCIWGASEKLAVTPLGKMPKTWRGVEDPRMNKILERVKQIRKG